MFVPCAVLALAIKGYRATGRRSQRCDLGGTAPRNILRHWRGNQDRALTTSPVGLRLPSQGQSEHFADWIFLSLVAVLKGLQNTAAKKETDYSFHFYS